MKGLKRAGIGANRGYKAVSLSLGNFNGRLEDNPLDTLEQGGVVSEPWYEK